MKYLLFCLLLMGCSSNIDSKHIKAGAFLCQDRKGVFSIKLDPIGSDLYICRDGSQLVVNKFIYKDPLEKVSPEYRWAVVYSEDKDSNKILDSILKEGEEK